MDRIPPPAPRELIPPVLVCLPTALVSRRPPPGLFHFLSPILRQRIHLLTSTSNSHTSSDSNWLGLLSYSPARAARLAEVIESMHLEPHPVSGELELFAGDEEPKIVYRRLDLETLRARCEVKEHGLTFVWVYCQGDEGGLGLEALEDAFGGLSHAATGASKQPADGWKVAEVVPAADTEDDDVRDEWYTTIAEANAAKPRVQSIPTPYAQDGASQPLSGSTAIKSQTISMPDDDEDYWASYDKTPGRTPVRTSARTPRNGHAGPMPFAMKSIYGRGQHRQQVEDDYYKRYGTEVQPALDRYDPDEQVDSVNSTLHTDQASSMPELIDQQHNMDDAYDRHQVGVAEIEYSSFMSETDFCPPPPSVHKNPDYHVPVTENPGSHESPRVSYPEPSGNPFPGDAREKQKLEDTAARPKPSSSSSSTAERGIKAHISYELKSLFRLAKGVGIQREEFERVVRTELELLSLLDDEI